MLLQLLPSSTDIRPQILGLSNVDRRPAAFEVAPGLQSQVRAAEVPSLVD